MWRSTVRLIYYIFGVIRIFRISPVVRILKWKTEDVHKSGLHKLVPHLSNDYPSMGLPDWDREVLQACSPAKLRSEITCLPSSLSPRPSSGLWVSHLLAFLVIPIPAPSLSTFLPPSSEPYYLRQLLPILVRAHSGKVKVCCDTSRPPPSAWFVHLGPIDLCRLFALIFISFSLQ